MNKLLSILFLFSSYFSWSQYSIEGTVTNFDDASKEEFISIIINNKLETVTDSTGKFKIENLTAGNYTLEIKDINSEYFSFEFEIKNKNIKKNIKLKPKTTELGTYEVIYKTDNVVFIKPRPVDGITVLSDKKVNIIKPDNSISNQNNARQLFQQIAGLNIWESDGGGIQLGIGGRGLSPDRSSNFNTRQNGYDISADALGYPESYYSPATEAIDRIYVMRGASSLQFGTQFGGVVNFKLKEGNDRKKIEVVSRSTIGSYNFRNQFLSLAGRVGTNRYYVFGKIKTGDDFRPNSGFEQQMAYGMYKKQLSENTAIKFEFTHMNYLAQQPGGLTDAMFEITKDTSTRERNWFKVNWNLAALNLDSKLSKKAKINLRLFALDARRSSLGFLGRADRIDFLEGRTLIDGKFNNLGAEARYMRYYLNDTAPSIFLGGLRFYKGRSTGTQGNADNGYGPVFEYLQPDSLNSDYLFPSYNVSAFAENIFNITEKFSITPGIRLEHIVTESEGYYTKIFYDLAGNVLEYNEIAESRNRKRTFILGGLGIGYDFSENHEVYANFSQNYRAITFNDMRITNSNFRINPNIQDEKGYTADIGFRGNIKQWFSYDVSGFYLYYNDRIGLISQVDNLLNSVYMLRTNVANSRNIGIEFFTDINFIKLFNDSSKRDLNLFMNTSFIDARYISANNPSIDGNFVELAPQFTLKTGLSYRFNDFGISWQFAHTGEHFTDATNSTFTANAVNGTITAYTIQDLSLEYTYNQIKFEGGINNLLDEQYFTRRASGYPGPGILPSIGRNFYLTLQIKI